MGSFREEKDVESIIEQNKAAAQILQVKDKKKHRIGIDITETQWQQLKTINHNKGASLTGILTVYINSYIEENKEFLY